VALNGREAGKRKDFDYSPAMRGSGIVWNDENLDRYLADPETMVPGTAMLTEPVEDAAERAALVHYIFQH
jgi:cytochrome c